MQLEDLELVDVSPSLSHTHEKIQMKKTSVATVSAATALYILKGKRQDPQTQQGEHQATELHLMEKLWKMCNLSPTC